MQVFQDDEEEEVGMECLADVELRRRRKWGTM
jgi:hypothetical protein